MTHKYAINEDALYQYIPAKYPDTGWWLVEDFTECGASEHVESVDFNEDAFELIDFPADILDDQFRMDAYAVRDNIMTLCQESKIHRALMRME